MKNLKRSIRRSHNARLMKKAIKIQQYRWNDYNRSEILFITASKIRDNLKNCSCMMCCNERRNKWLSNRNRLSMQERKMMDYCYE